MQVIEIVWAWKEMKLSYEKEWAADVEECELDLAPSSQLTASHHHLALETEFLSSSSQCKLLLPLKVNKQT